MFPYAAIQEEVKQNRLTVWREDEKRNAAKYYLRITPTEANSILQTSNIYIILNHQLNRRLARTDDKLVVSVFFLLNHILKFHNTGFDRQDLHRVSEALDIHASPELMHITELILSDVLRPYLRIIRNSLHRYRFLSIHEREIQHIAEVSDIESSAYNFALDSQRDVRQHYQRLLHELHDKDAQHNNPSAYAETHIVLGNMALWEREYDKAVHYYSTATWCLAQTLGMHHEPSSAQSALHLHPAGLNTSIAPAFNQIIFSTYVESMLLQGQTEEKRQDFTRAAAIYAHLEHHVQHFNQQLQIHSDSKKEIYYLAKWSLLFLHLKRGSSHHKRAIKKLTLSDILPDVSRYISYNRDTSMVQPYSHLRLGTLKLFFNHTDECQYHFKKVIQHTETLHLPSQRGAYLSGSAKLRLAFSQIIGPFTEAHKALKKEASTIKINQKLYQTANRILTKKLKNTLNLIQSVGDDFAQSSLHTEAAQTYVSGIFIAILCWEALPYSTLNRQQRKDLEKQGDAFYDNIIPLITSADKNLDLAHRSAFSHFQKRFFYGDLNQYSKTNTEEKPYRQIKKPINFIIRLLEKNKLSCTDEEQLIKKFEEDHSWQDSPLGSVLTMSALWLYRVRYYTIYKYHYGHIDSMYGDSIPPAMVMYAAAIGEYLMTRNKQRQMLRDIQNQSVADIIKSAIEIVERYYKTYTVAKKSSRHNQSLTLPPAAFTFYNLCEFLNSVLDALHRKKETKIIDTRQPLEDTVNQLRDQFIKKASKNNRKNINSYFFDYSIIYHKTLDTLNAMESMIDTNSSARREVLYTKYFLDDDYEDILFQMNWTFYQCLVPGAIAHKAVIEERHKKLQALYEPENLNSNSSY